VVDAVDDGQVGAVGRGGHEHHLGAGVEMDLAFSLAEKMPVHSMQMSTPRSFHGRVRDP